ncbi:UspA domain protein [Nitrosococcus halophilus Nc 4]|uniref:UspA domain protein n=1 Tax=Nitrosococcus halophilus (strain Nc4) TaxID=472759 RepID=D5C360_NITHN|nr:universal stress protein [Nitrosococcus halophilus]ADE14952.1 UspA domain protein [Nitrosococcus halophilus Nc 4]ADE14968.1 UspA domain protein [Nitrosococcus halophilus Nc 4]
MSAEFNDIIVPVDGSENSLRAARFASDLAKAMGSKMTLVYVFTTRSGGNFDFLRITHPEEEDIEQLKKEAARKIFDKTYQALGGKEGEIKEESLSGDPATEIIQYLEKYPSSITVMGRRGLSRFEALLLGSVSEKVVRHATGPVTIIH